MMKKQLLFCSLALASSMTAFANQGDVVTSIELLSPDKVYIVNPATDQKRGTWRVNPNNLNTLSSTVLTGATMLDYADPYQQFAFLKSSTGHYYIYNTATDRFFAAGNNSVSLVERPMSDASYVAFETSTNTAAANLFLVALDGQYMNLNASQGVAFYGSLGSTEPGFTGDKGNSLQIIEAGDIEEAAKTKALDKIEAFEAAYTEENKTATEALNTEVGGFLSVPQYAVGGYDPQLWQNLNDACGGDGVVDIYDYVNNATKIQADLAALKNAGTTSPDFGNDKVYIIQNKIAGNGYMYAKEGDSRIFSSTKNSSLATVPNSDKWQLHEEDGKYYLYNQGTQTYAEYNGSAWGFTPVPTVVNVGQNTNKGVALFWIQDAAHTGQLEYMHVNNGVYENGVVGWETAADASNFYFVEVPDAEVVALANLALTREKMLAEEIIDGNKTNYVGSYSAAAIETLRQAVDAQDATIESIQAAFDAVESERLHVQSGNYYFILNAMQFNDGGVKAIYESPDGQNVSWHTTEGTAAELWQLESDNGGQFYIKSVNTGRYLQLPLGSLGYMQDAVSNPFKFIEKDDNMTFGLETYYNNDHSTLALYTGTQFGSTAQAGNVSGDYIGTYNGYGSIPTTWNVAEATSVNLTIGSTGYATAYFPFAVTIPEGVKAYTVSDAAGGVATLSPLTGTIPANTGVILSGDAKTYPFAITTSEVSKVEGNMLDGVTIATDLDPETSYILANGANGLGFYKVDPTDTKLAANKAYLNNANGSFFSLKLDGAVTGIQSVENAAENAPAYDLQGRRLPQVPTKGLYIQNGKKIMK